MKRLGVATSAMAAGLLVVGCGGSNNKAVSSASTASAGGGAAPAGAGTSGQIKQLTDAVQAGQRLTFKAVYTTGTTGSSGALTFEQKPPKSVVADNGSTFINDGTNTYICSDASGQKSCLSSSAGQNPMAGLIQAISPATILTALQQFQSQAVAHLAGVDLSFSSETFAGQASSCVSVKVSGNPSGKYCVTKEGVVSYIGGGGSTFELTSYTTDVPDSDFSLPAGATTMTLPGG